MIASPFFVENLKRLPGVGQSLAPLKAIAYHLAKVLPRGGVVGVVYPKGIAEEILAGVAKERNCRIRCFGASQKLCLQLQREGVLEVREDVPIDVFLTEPDGFGPNGAWVRPNESELLVSLPVVGFGSVLQWSQQTPKSHDLVPLKGVVSEKGVYNSTALLDEEVRATLPWLVS
ncbi:hypothetical protein C4580_06265 [Candidatus Woesearchaeota archaeon]|nr:MAG: hypothetical protein C4580_06265 [Candidatus Woesearchaeota archaeon]